MAIPTTTVLSVPPQVADASGLPLIATIRIAGLVASPIEPPPITGTVQFKNVTAGSDIGNPVSVFPEGVAAYCTEPGDLELGPNRLSVTYSGDANYASSSGNGQVVATGEKK
jgi:hypothetical protein